MSDSLAETQRRVFECLTRDYCEKNERMAMRGALFGAANVCDALATVIGHEHRMRGGKITKRGQMLAMVATRAADAIMAMREKSRGSAMSARHFQEAIIWQRRAQRSYERALRTPCAEQQEKAAHTSHMARRALFSLVCGPRK